MSDLPMIPPAPRRVTGARRESVERVARLYGVPPWIIDLEWPVPRRLSLERLRWRIFVWRWEWAHTGER